MKYIVIIVARQLGPAVNSKKIKKTHTKPLRNSASGTILNLSTEPPRLTAMEI